MAMLVYQRVMGQNIYLSHMARLKSTVSGGFLLPGKSSTNANRSEAMFDRRMVTLW